MTRILLTLAVLLLPALGKQIPKAPSPNDDEQKKQESSTKDLKVASSYSYRQSNSPADDDVDLGTTSRFRSFNFQPVVIGGFNFPTKYRVGSIAGVGSGSDGLGRRLSRKHYSNGDVDDYGPPATFEYHHRHDDGHDLLDHHLHDDDHVVEKHEGKGEQSQVKHESSGEHEAAKGYKVVEDFDKGEKSELKKGEQSGHQNEEASLKKGHEDEVKHQSSHEESSQAAKGENFNNSEGHKKGHKTTGYHNVYHKDEYKKDTSFYDDEHQSAQQEKYDREDREHADSEVAHKKNESVDAAFEQADSAKKGFFTNGHQYGSSQGHDSEHGLDEHHQHDESSSKHEDESSSHSHH